MIWIAYSCYPVLCLQFHPVCSPSIVPVSMRIRFSSKYSIGFNITVSHSRLPSKLTSTLDLFDLIFVKSRIVRKCCRCIVVPSNKEVSVSVKQMLVSKVRCTQITRLKCAKQKSFMNRSENDNDVGK